MKISEKPLQLILKKDFAEAIKAGVQPYEFRMLGFNLGAKLFKGGPDWDNYVKYPSIRFQIGYSKKYLLVELVNTCFVTLDAIEQTNPPFPERMIWTMMPSITPRNTWASLPFVKSYEDMPMKCLQHIQRQKKKTSQWLFSNSAKSQKTAVDFDKNKVTWQYLTEKREEYILQL